mmetsp:Transcript_74099/g.131026  ORF Transcript_74099/g.131026 Transcript_74099/m.131026 type:complete len:242 (+) Transcript_74099:253-978(+)
MATASQAAVTSLVEASSGYSLASRAKTCSASSNCLAVASSSDLCTASSKTPPPATTGRGARGGGGKKTALVEDEAGTDGRDAGALGGESSGATSRHPPPAASGAPAPAMLCTGRSIGAGGGAGCGGWKWTYAGGPPAASSARWPPDHSGSVGATGKGAPAPSAWRPPLDADELPPVSAICRIRPTSSGASGTPAPRSGVNHTCLSDAAGAGAGAGAAKPPPAASGSSDCCSRKDCCMANAS